LDQRTIDRYCDLWVAMARKGKLSDYPDLWIAASASAKELAVVTRNPNHFASVPGLAIAAYVLT
jgi:hypothetical protein